MSPVSLISQNLALERSWVPSAIEAVEMLAGIRAGIPEGHGELPGY